MIPDKCRPVHKSNCRGASSPFDFAPDSLVDCAQVRPREDGRPPLPELDGLQRADGLTPELSRTAPRSLRAGGGRA